MYEAYAAIYHQMNQGAWSEYLARWTLDWLHAHGIVSGQSVDWGCGDGAAAVHFAQAGWQVVGIDRSRKMLAQARRRPQPPGRISWREGDLCCTTVDSPGNVATAFYDTLNYLTSLADLQAAWQTLARSIIPGGYVIADVNTPYEYETAWNGRSVITADTDDLLVLNRLRYVADTRLATGRIFWFVRDAHTDLWRRGSETHRQRAHTHAEMVAAITEAGLRLVECRTPQHEPSHPMATRLIYIAQKG